MEIRIQLSQKETNILQNIVVKTMMTLGRSPMDAVTESNKILNVQEYDVNLIGEVASDADGTELSVKTSDKVGCFIMNLFDKITAFAVDIVKWVKPAVKQATVNASTITVIDVEGNKLSALYIEDAPEPEMLRAVLQGDDVSRVYINTRAARPDYDLVIPEWVVWEYVTSSNEAFERLNEAKSQHEAGEKEE